MVKLSLQMGLGLAYCLLRLSAISARFFWSTENVVKHTCELEIIDPCTGAETIRHEIVEFHIGRN